MSTLKDLIAGLERDLKDLISMCDTRRRILNDDELRILDIKNMLCALRELQELKK